MTIAGNRFEQAVSPDPVGRGYDKARSAEKIIAQGEAKRTLGRPDPQISPERAQDQSAPQIP